MFSWDSSASLSFVFFRKLRECYTTEATSAAHFCQFLLFCYFLPGRPICPAAVVLVGQQQRVLLASTSSYLASLSTAWPIRCWSAWLSTQIKATSNSSSQFHHPTGVAWDKIKTISKLIQLGFWMAQVEIPAPASDWPGQQQWTCGRLILSLMQRPSVVTRCAHPGQ